MVWHVICVTLKQSAVIISLNIKKENTLDQNTPAANATSKQDIKVNLIDIMQKSTGDTNFLVSHVFMKQQGRITSKITDVDAYVSKERSNNTNMFFIKFS